MSTILSDKNPCEHFYTKSRAHMASAHREVLSLQSSFRSDGASYCHNEMWFPLDEAEEIVRVLQEAIACQKEHQAAQARGEGGDR